MRPLPSSAKQAVGAQRDRDVVAAAHLDAEERAGVTPMTGNGVPSSVTVRPGRRVAAELALPERIADHRAGDPQAGVSSSAVKVRPSIGFTPSTRKKSPLTYSPSA